MQPANTDLIDTFESDHVYYMLGLFCQVGRLILQWGTLRDLFDPVWPLFRLLSYLPFLSTFLSHIDQFANPTSSIIPCAFCTSILQA